MMGIGNSISTSPPRWVIDPAEVKGFKVGSKKEEIIRKVHNKHN